MEPEWTDPDLDEKATNSLFWHIKLSLKLYGLRSSGIFDLGLTGRLGADGLSDGLHLGWSQNGLILIWLKKLRIHCFGT